MSNKLIQLTNLGLNFANKCCFANFNATIYANDKIALIGPNGAGKSSLLKILTGIQNPSNGTCCITNGTQVNYVPQLISSPLDLTLSGAQRFQQSLTKGLSCQPNLLLLDEPTNHLDRQQRKNLLIMLHKFSDSLVVATHDQELLYSNIFKEFWHLDGQGKITIFKGTYAAWLEHNQIILQQQQQKLILLKKEHKHTQKALQNEQKRAAQSRKANRYENDRNLLGTYKNRGEQTAGKNRGKLNQLRANVNQALKDCVQPQSIQYNWNLSAKLTACNLSVICINDGSLGYKHNEISKTNPILHNLNLSLATGQKIGLIGNNGCGKSSFFKALMQAHNIWKQGEWIIPKPDEIGYLEQHYANLNPNLTAIENLSTTTPNWDKNILQKHLNAFLLKTPQEVNTPIQYLSGGQQARLSLAILAAKPPKLLLLDEITNNLDIASQEHAQQVLSHYPGAMLIISHDEHFLQQLNLDGTWLVENQTIRSL